VGRLSLSPTRQLAKYRLRHFLGSLTAELGTQASTRAVRRHWHSDAGSRQTLSTLAKASELAPSQPKAMLLHHWEEKNWESQFDLLHVLLNDPLALVIERDQGASDGNPLLLATGKARAALLDDGIVSLRQLEDELMRSRASGAVCSSGP
jgi:hypothetical protein